MLIIMSVCVLFIYKTAISPVSNAIIGKYSTLEILS